MTGAKRGEPFGRRRVLIRPIPPLYVSLGKWTSGLGVTTRLEKQKKGLFGAKGKHDGSEEISRSAVVQPAVYRENSRISLFVTLMAGVAAGAAAFWASGSSCH